MPEVPGCVIENSRLTVPMKGQSISTLDPNIRGDPKGRKKYITQVEETREKALGKGKKNASICSQTKHVCVYKERRIGSSDYKGNIWLL